MSASVTLTGEARIAPLPRNLPLEHGGSLESGHVAFEVQGPEGAPVVVVLGGISAHRHLASHPGDPSPGWWETQVGPGRALDTTRFRVVGIDWLAGPGGSIGSATGRPRTAFPIVSPTDQARAVTAVLDTLEVERADAVVGASYGASVALAFGAAHPERTRSLAVLSGAHRSHPLATALRSLQRRILRLGVRTGSVREGVALARGVAMTTYRTAEEFDLRFHGLPTFTPDGIWFPVDGYLDAHGERFSERFSPEAFLALSESLDLTAVDPAEVAVPARVLAVRQDTLVPLWLLEELVEGLGAGGELTVIDSLYGHDAFLKEEEGVDAFLRRALLQGDAGRPRWADGGGRAGPVSARARCTTADREVAS